MVTARPLKIRILDYFGNTVEEYDTEGDWSVTQNCQGGSSLYSFRISQ